MLFFLSFTALTTTKRKTFIMRNQTDMKRIEPLKDMVKLVTLENMVTTVITTVKASVDMELVKEAMADMALILLDMVDMVATLPNMEDIK